MLRKLLAGMVVLVFLVLGMVFVQAKQAKAEVEVAIGGIGDVLLFPLYDVRETADRTDKWENYLVIENTSGAWVAAHLRFRAWRKSIEVYDHVILLSPYDVFWIDIVRRSDGTVKLWSGDTETLRNSGMIYPPATKWETTLQTHLLEDCGYTEDAGYDLNAEVQAGYVEVIGLWQLEIPGGAAEDTHDITDIVGDVFDDTHPGNINVYDVLDALFYYNAEAEMPHVWNDPPANISWPDEAMIKENSVDDGDPVDGDERGNDEKERRALDCENVLAASMEFGDITTGRYELENYIALKDFRTDEEVHRDGTPMGAIIFPTNVMFWYCYDDPAYYLNPDWATTVGATLRDGDDIFGANSPAVDDFNNIWSLDDVENVLNKSQIWYQYYNDAFDATIDTDVVLTFPTKHLHFFFEWWPWFNMLNFPGPFASCNDYIDAVYAYREWIESDFDDLYDNGPISAHAYLWDTEQNIPGPPGEPPPGSPWHPPIIPGEKIPHEVNIIRVGETSGTGINEANGLLFTEYDHGHFMIRDWALDTAATDDLRAWGFDGTDPHPLYGYEDDGDTYTLPPIGIVEYLHTYGGEAVVRSCMAEWHYQPAIILLLP